MASPIPAAAEKLAPRTTPIDFSVPADISSLTGKSILVTGGASGIGLACVTAFAAAGAHVTIADLQVEAGARAADDLTRRGFKVQAVECNVTDFDSQFAAFRSAVQYGGGRLDVVVPNAGILAQKNVFDMVAEHPVSLDTPPPAPGMSGLDVNLKGVYYSCYLALHFFRLPPPPNSPPFKKAVVLLGSCASYTGYPSSATYSMSKFGVRGLFYGTRDKAMKQDPPVRVNFVGPWFIKTAMTSQVAHSSEQMSKYLETLGYAPIEGVVDAVLRLGADENVSGRSALVMPEGNVDAGDNVWEGYGGLVFQQYMGRRYGEILKKMAAAQAPQKQD